MHNVAQLIPQPALRGGSHTVVCSCACCKPRPWGAVTLSHCMHNNSHNACKLGVLCIPSSLSVTLRSGSPCVKPLGRRKQLLTSALVKLAGERVHDIDTAVAVHMQVCPQHKTEGCVCRNYALRPWEEVTPAFKYNPATPYSHIFVPTADTTCYKALLSYAIEVRHPVLLTGKQLHDSLCIAHVTRVE